MTKLTNAEKAKIEAAAVSSVEKDAFNAGESRARLCASVLNVCGAKPTLVLFEKIRLASVVGFMASALARKGDNRPDEVLRAHCRDRIVNYQGATGTAKLRAGQKGRRTPDEELAYGSARQLTSTLWKSAGITVPVKSGTNSNSKASAAAKAKAKGKSAKGKAERNDRPSMRTFKTAEAITEYALIQAKAMQGTLNKSAKSAPERLGMAINHFLTEVLGVADDIGMVV